MASLRNSLRRVVPETVRKSVTASVRMGRDMGWIRTLRTGSAVDRDGNPVPWFTYPAFEYLESLDLSSCRLFEFGAGASTVYWQGRCAEIVAVESNPEWYDRVGTRLDASRTTLVLREDAPTYAAAITEQEGQFDIIVIDGFFRTACIDPALERLAPGGMIIFDNSDWFPDLAARLRAADLIEVDFAGFGPINPYRWVTSVFLHRDARFEPRGDQPAPPVGGLTFDVPDAEAMDRLLR